MKFGKRQVNGVGLLFVLALGAALVLPTISSATSITAKKPGDVYITFKGSDADHSLSLLHNGKTVFNNKTSAVGQRIKLGTFKAGEKIDLVLKNNTTGHTFTLGSGNAMLNDTFGPDSSWLRWEDLFGGGDRDFNDLETLLENITSGDGDLAQNLPRSDDPGSVGTPEPTTVILMGSGLLFLAAWRWKKKGTEPSE